VDKPTDQISIAGTIAQLMGVQAEHAESRILEEAIA